MIRFVENDAAGLPLKRKQSQRACERCRKRKKRCPHHNNAQQAEGDSHGVDQGSNSWSKETDSTGTVDKVREEHPRISHAHQNTDSVPGPSISLLHSPATAASMSSATGGTHNGDIDDEDDRDPRFVGELNPESTIIAGASPAGMAAQGSTNSPEDVVGIWVPRKLINTGKIVPGPILPELLPYLEDQCSRALPQPPAYEALYRIYAQYFHPVIPVINLEAYHKMQGKVKVMIKLAICLSVCGNPKANIYLKRPPQEFSFQMTQLLRSAIDNDLIRDKQVIIQILIVLALSTQLSDERHASAEFACRAVSYIHTFGLHQDTTSRSDNTNVTRLFCCALAVDRLNAAIQGRPVLMHERDIGRDIYACIKQQDSLFQLLLRVVLLLDQVIPLYRPASTVGNVGTDHSRVFDLGFPAFEDLLGECGTIRAPAALVATVETLYHAVAMLSCRSQSLNEMSRNSIAHARQSLSAANIMSIAGNEFKGQLSILPFVPYALTLALRVFYRDLRLSKSSFTRVRARRQLVEVCVLLRELGGVFASSLHMADLAEHMVQEMDRAYSAVVSQRRDSLAAATATAAAASDSQPSEMQHVQTVISDQDVVGHHQSAQTSIPAALTTDSSAEPSNGVAAFELAQFDFDLDIFDYFDPDFNIEAIDAALATSIDPALPGDMIDWNTFGG